MSNSTPEPPLVASSVTLECAVALVMMMNASSLSATFAETPSALTFCHAGSVLSTLCRMMPLWPLKSLLMTGIGAPDGLPPTKKRVAAQPAVDFGDDLEAGGHDEEAVVALGAVGDRASRC